MSDYNRNLFLKRLAKHNVLSANKMVHFWPRIKQIIVDCPIECILQCNNQTWKIDKQNNIITYNINAGSQLKLKVNKLSDELKGKNIKFSLSLYVENEQLTTNENIIIEGNCELNSDIICSFVAPLVSPWTYDIVANKFNINLRNVNIKKYPDDCRS